MTFPNKVEYVIIGAGIHGLSTAWHLAQKLKAKGKGDGSKIVVIDTEDIAAAALYLASNEASYITGQTLHINGGMAML